MLKFLCNFKRVYLNLDIYNCYKDCFKIKIFVLV